MNSWTDSQLLRVYANRRSEDAFAELVRRHLDLVYSAALRMVGDAHLAQDVSQGAFVALAQKAGELEKHPVLSGWLHLTTRNLAANTVRSSVRRQVHEQEAAAMNELLSADSDVPWDCIAPHLDSALGELNEGERHALLLRYFEHKSAREMAQVLGISDEAAQKRASRALERLREFLARRGVAVGAGALLAALSANAVQAAPAGLAAALSAAAAAGAIVPTATVANATKIIAMTTLQKTFVAATLLAVVGAGIYGVRESAQARTEAQAARQREAALLQSIDQLQHERDQATNQLARVGAELVQMKSAQTPPELLKLRGQVGSLRQQLATAGPNSNAPATGFARMMGDPAMRDYIQQALMDLVKRRYAPLVQELNLTPEQTDQFIQLLSAEFGKGAQRLAATQNGAPAEDRSDLKQSLKALLGDSGAARFGEFTQEVPARTTVDLLDTQLGASKLTDDQKTRLFQVVKAEPFDITHGISGDLDHAFFGSQPQIDAYLAKIADSNQRVLQQASSFLSADQLTALDSVLANGITARTTQAAAFTQKH